jgi:hypothetical protein
MRRVYEGADSKGFNAKKIAENFSINNLTVKLENILRQRRHRK